MQLGKLFVDTKYGGHVVSKSSDTICVRLDQYRFDELSDVWVISHIYETEALTIQSFSDGDSIIPERVIIVDNDTIRLEFNEPRTGFCNALFYTNVNCDCDDAAINPSPTPTQTVTPTPTSTQTPTPSVTAGVTPTPTGTQTPTPSVTAAVTSTVTPTPTLTPTTTLTPTPTPTPSIAVLANDLALLYDPSAMYTFQDADFSTTLIDETGNYNLTANGSPNVVFDPWRTSNSQYCEVLSGSPSFNDPISGTGSVQEDIFGPGKLNQTIVIAYRSSSPINASGWSELVGIRSQNSHQKWSVQVGYPSDTFSFQWTDAAEIHQGISIGLAKIDGDVHILSVRVDGTLFEAKVDNGAWASKVVATAGFSADATAFDICLQPLGFTDMSADFDLISLYSKTLTRSEIDDLHSAYMGEYIVPVTPTPTVTPTPPTTPTVTPTLSLTPTPLNFPAGVSDLVVWLDGTDISNMYQDDAMLTPVTATGQDVAVWADKSGNSNDFTQTSASLRPTYITGDYLDFSLDYFYGPDLSALTAGEIFIGLKADNPSVNNGGWHHFGTDTGASSANHYPWSGNTIYDGFGTTSRLALSGGLNAILEVPHVTNISVDSGQHIFRIDGVTYNTTAATIGFRSNPTLGTAIRQEVYDTTYALDGRIYSVLIYDRKLTDQERSDVLSYMSGVVPVAPTPTPTPTPAPTPTATVTPSVTPSVGWEFVPTQISGLTTWLDGADPGVTSLTWDDKSGNNDHWTSVGATSFPTYQVGDGSMEFDGTDQLFGPNLSAMTSGEIFIKLKVTGDNGLWWFSDKNDDGDWYPYSLDNRIYLGWGSTTRSAGGLVHGETLSTYHTLNIHSATNDWSLSINGTVKETKASNTVTFVSNPYIGKMQAAGYWLTGNIKSICIFNRKLTTQERVDMNDYMDAL